MNTVTQQHIIASRLMRAGAAALATFVGTALAILLFALALEGPHTLLSPSVFGLFGPPLIEVMVRPTIVTAAFAGAVMGIVVFLETAVAATPPAAGHGEA